MDKSILNKIKKLLAGATSACSALENTHGIDLQAACLAKMEENEQRGTRGRVK